MSPLSFANGRTANEVIVDESIPRSVHNGDVNELVSERMNQKPATKTTTTTPTPIQNSPRRVGADITEPEDVVLRGESLSQVQNIINGRLQGFDEAENLMANWTASGVNNSNLWMSDYLNSIGNINYVPPPLGSGEERTRRRPGLARINAQVSVESILPAKRDQVIRFPVIQPDTEREERQERDPGFCVPLAADLDSRPAEEIQRRFPPDHHEHHVVVDRVIFPVGIRDRDLVSPNLFHL